MSRLKLTVLSPAEIARIHRRSLQVLEKVGFKVQDGECRQTLARAGARVDNADDRVFLPAGLVEEAVQQAPSLIRLCRQDGKLVRLGGRHRIYSSLVVDPWIIEYETQRPRRPVLGDIVRHTRLGDAHPLIDAIHRMDMPPADVRPETAYVRSLEAFVTHTTKHLIARPSSAESLRHWVEVAEILADGHTLAERPLITFGAAITSPLVFNGLNAEILKTAVRKGVPVLPTISAMAGSTSPRSFAGTLVITNAENLFFVTIAQLLRPGAPVVYWSGQSVTDLRTGRDVYYAADKMLWHVANTQLAHFYHLPVRGEAGGTLVARYDVQCGIENALLMLGTLVSGSHWLGGLGSNYNAVGMSAEMIVIQADLAQLLKRCSAGIDTREEMLASASIAQAGPGGHFLTDELTLKMLRSAEFHSGGSFDYSGEAGSDGPPVGPMLARAHARVEELLAAHTPAVSPAIVEEVQRWARRAAPDT
jgi:trimethylamine--corrinoid protein Co-methyltransferase